MGRVARETRTIGTAVSTVSYTWDPAGSGKLSSLTLPSGFVVTYGYDTLGRTNLMSVGPGAGGPFTPVAGNITYFPFGSLQQIGSYNGVARYQSDDLQYRPQGLFLTKGSTSLINRFFAYSDKLNITEINNDSTGSGQTQDFNYDDAQRLSYATGPYGSRYWQYDKVGNRLSELKTVSGTSTTQTYTYPATSNRLTGVTLGSTTPRAFTYDAAGNTIQDSRSGTAYTYTISDAGRIAQVKVGGTVNANYIYDFKSRLSVRQTIAMSPAGTTTSLYDLWDHLLAETDATGHALREYLWLGDEPAAVLDWTVNGSYPVLFYVHTDHLHRPEVMTDTSGNVVWKATYEPFGTVSTVTGSVTQNRRFPGQYFQIEAGLAYNWYRHYDATIGRYTTPDPLGVRAGASVFGYALQSPLMLSDSRGLDNPSMGPYDPAPASPMLADCDGSTTPPPVASPGPAAPPISGTPVSGPPVAPPAPRVPPAGSGGGGSDNNGPHAPDGTPIIPAASANDPQGFKMARAAASAAGLDREQRRIFHDAITGQGITDYQELLSIALQVK